MAAMKKNNQKVLYFSERVRASFPSFLEHPCTVVEAPIGYGKTTAVTEAVDSIGAEVIWQKVYDRGAAEFWAGFCQAISKIDKECAQGLKNIGMLEGSLMKRELMQLLNTLNIPKTTFLVIDDYHFIKSQSADDFLRLLILNMPENLHLIIITRIAFLGNSLELRLKGLVNHIDVNILGFSQSDIKNYFRLLGIHLETNEVEQLYEYSEGWVSALYLTAMDYKIHGSFLFTRNVPELVYETAYEPLDKETKYFLMSICHLDVFTLEQAQYIWEKENTKELLDTLLSCNSFVSQDRTTENYSLHNIFGLCVREQFMHLPEDYQKTIWRKIGEVQHESKQYMQAMQSFYHAKHFDGIMETMNRGEKLISHLNEYKDLLISCYRECPIEVKVRNPLSVLMFGLCFVTQHREPQLFAEICRDFHHCMEENTVLSEDERSQLLGEYEVLQTFTVFNDIIKMGEFNSKAAGLLKSPPRFINTKNSFLFGTPSPLYLYYRESGKLADIIDFIHRDAGLYARNTKGHGMGYRQLLEAEWQYNTCDFDNAEITANKAISVSHESGDADVELGGMFLLARLAMFRGGFLKVLEQLEKMEKLMRYEVKQYQTFWLVYLMDLCKAYIYTCLDRTEQIPDWIFEYEYPKHMHFMSIAYANIVYGKALLLKDENLKLLGLAETFNRQAGIFPNLIGIIYTHIYMAIAAYRLKRTDDCHAALKTALDTAMPDDMLMPFVENTKALIPILDVLGRENKYQVFIKKIKDIYEMYNQSVQKIIIENFNAYQPQLTGREKQIAMLVLEGLNNKEIAGQLFISPNTVKLELKNIFRKLNISSRALLKKEMIS